MQPDPVDIARVRRALGAAPVAWRVASGHGAPSNRRFVVKLEDRGTAFVKIAALDYTADWLRDEHRVYEALAGHPFLPRSLGWDDDGLAPALVIEDLSGETWPPPWDAARVDAVLATLDDVHATSPPAGAPPAVERQFGLDGWPDVIADPQPFLALGICSSAWLEEHLPTLASASASAEIGGDSLLHFDVRSDNLCMRGDRAVLVDWNNACVGNPVLDTAAWLPSLQNEGVPAPVEILPDATPGLPRIASLLAGYFSARAGLSPIPQAPHARPSSSPNRGPACPGRPASSGSRRPPSSSPLVAPATHCYDARMDASYVDLMDELRSRGLRMTPQRRAIVSEVMRAKGHISPTAIARKVQGDMPGVNASTVYRTLTLLESVGVLQHSHVETGAEYHRADEAHHVHLTCRNCGQDDELSLEEARKLQGLIKRHHGFVADLTHFAITGLCSDCAA